MRNKKCIPILLFSLSVLMLTGCHMPGFGPAPTSTPTITRIPPTDTFTYTPSVTPSPTNTPTITLTPTVTDTPTLTLTLAPTDTPTPEPLIATVLENANCRMGPHVNYLGQFVVHEGEELIVEGRDYGGYWVWVSPPGQSAHCWVSVAVLELSGDVKEAKKVVIPLPVAKDVPDPSGVTAHRNGNFVVVSWNAAPDAPELHYLIVASTCLNGYMFEDVYKTTNTSISIQDDKNLCGDSKSKGVIRVVNKLGYSDPVTINWPK